MEAIKLTEEQAHAIGDKSAFFIHGLDDTARIRKEREAEGFLVIEAEGAGFAGILVLWRQP